MRIKTTLLGAIIAGCSFYTQASFTQQQLAQFASDTHFEFAVENNFSNGAGGFSGAITLTNNSKVDLPKGQSDWQIYLHSVRHISTETAEGLRFEHINGDLHRITPTDSFAGLKAGEKLKLAFDGSAWVAAYSDFMPRAFIVSGKNKPVIFTNTDTEDMTQFVAPFERENQLKRYNTPTDYTQIANAALRFERNQSNISVSKEDALRRIIPKPEHIDFSRGEITLNKNWQIRFAGRLKSEVAVFQEDLSEYGLDLKAEANHVPEGNIPTIRLKVAKSLGRDYDYNQAGSYTLDIDDDVIEITGIDNAGVFYGIQSLLALFPADSKNEITLSHVEIKDSPRFSWRGMHYDNARNYHGKDALFKLIEQMARYKLNKFHWHFSDDEGWRLEIPGLPELTEVGAFRCFDLQERECLLTQLGTGPFKTGSGNGYLSREDFVELLKFATARHIEIIPEIESPGHARAAIKSMEARYHKLMEAGKAQEAKAYLLNDVDDTSKYLTVQLYTDNSINVCLDSSYAFMEKVVYELQEMYRDAGTMLTTVHFGGDEVGKGSWTESPACNELFAVADNGVAGPNDLKPYFTQKVAKLLAKRGITPAAWEDGLMYSTTTTFKRDEFPNPQFLVNTWDNIWEWGVADRAHRFANNNYQVILSHGTHLYFDHPYEAHPEERGYYWATRYTDTKKAFSYMPDNIYANADFTRNREPIVNLEALVGRELPALKRPQNILGMQGQIWSETIRSEDQVLRLIFPRLLSLAERAWHKADWEGRRINQKELNKDFSTFAAALSLKEIAKLQNDGIKPNLPVPGAKVVLGKLEANSAFPYLAIEVSLDNGESWQPYTDQMSISDESKVLLRTRAGEKNTSRVTGLK
ncbi:family 20 glycosylhydrolase [Pseudoalteromonas piscicida]|uniref:beta-N-acetylhexosaminidase n=1 Tax=Pseudoalteromonas piscicida TaxID=43662 RepID=A0ABM6NIX4_PSEO7|nr:family 20 glycosylhydrolase [Pseudoalteromonas piscicida]ATD08917.1 hexosaminidase [Pseudoalteromonas piscicida]WPU30905.1 family 20 glycosylhydrolase [Pseudoalteromonas piscicida]